MSSIPTFTKIPSEHTVEVLANHYLISGIARARCWIFCPSTNEELLLGYDAATKNTKSVVIQYKALTYTSSNTVSAPIDAAQLGTLLANFNAKTWPYVFYGFCTHRNYKEVDDGYKSNNSPEFFDNCIFVSIHDLPTGVSRLRYSFKTNTVLPIVSSKTKKPIHYLRGRELVCGITSCKVGDRHIEPRSFQKLTVRGGLESHGRTTGLSVLKVPMG